MCRAIVAEKENAPEDADAPALSGPESQLLELVVTKEEYFIVYLTGANEDKAVLAPGSVDGLGGAAGQINNEQSTFYSELRSIFQSVKKADGQKLFRYDNDGSVVGGRGYWCLIADLPVWARTLPVPPESKLTTSKPNRETAAQGKPGTLKLHLSPECVPWIARAPMRRPWVDEPTFLYANRCEWPYHTRQWQRENPEDGGDDAVLFGDPAAVAGALQDAAGAAVAEEPEEPAMDEEIVGGVMEEEVMEDAVAEAAAAAAAEAVAALECPHDEPLSVQEQERLIAIADAADAAAAEAAADAADAAAAAAAAEEVVNRYDEEEEHARRVRQ
eukprot:5619495-Prymnesium_polylepis.1